MMWYSSDGWGWVSWLLMSVGMVLFWAVIITALVLAVYYLVGERGATAGLSNSRRAEEILAERLSRGELDDTEYRERLALLREQRR